MPTGSDPRRPTNRRVRAFDSAFEQGVSKPTAATAVHRIGPHHETTWRTFPDLPRSPDTGAGPGSGGRDRRFRSTEEFEEGVVHFVGVGPTNVVGPTRDLD